MSATSSSLIEFLHTRIAEDEAVARAAKGKRWTAVVDTPDDDDHEGSIYADGDWSSWVVNWDGGSQNGAHIVRHDPARVLAECEAKRRIVESLQNAERAGMAGDYVKGGCALGLAEAASILAAVYADHADYRAEWKP